MNTSPTPNHKWRFFRIGGFDQVRLDTPADLVNIGELDPKLWVALACPVKGVAFDAKTLALLDTDGDGYIRVPEVVAAARWVGSVLKDHAPITAGDGVVPLAAFNDNTAEGRGLLGSARQVLASLGKADASSIGAADTADIAAIFAHMHHNGDGIIPAHLAADPDDAATISTIVDRLGGEPDRSGKPGVDETRINRFFDEGAAVLAWHDRGADETAVRTLGDDTHAAADAFRSVRAKVDDFFTRVQLASFDAKAAAALNPAESAYATINPATLAASREEIAALPLALVAAGSSLPLTEGINPAWASALATLRNKVVCAVLGKQDALSAEDWARICATFDAHEAWQAAKPQTPLAALDINALRSHLATGRRERLLALVADDLAAAPEANGIAALDKLLRYCRDLHRFTNNFVSFREFYTRRESIFQAGSLFLDGRSCELTVPVLDAGKHAALAGLAGIYLVYCDCIRNGQKMTIAAAFTDGEADQLMVGRNGVFWDRDGHDWNATITKIVEHPISVRQAFWTPYKRVARFIGEQVNKFAASKSDGVDKQLASGIETKAASVAAPSPAPTPAAPAAPFDIAKFAGIFAAIGLAFGAIGTALAAIVTGFLSLKAWQMPMVLLGIMLLISGPSMLLAFLKLRRRNLGPLLDANGWAVNARALINIPFGTSLTRMAELPAGAERSLVDPYASKKPVWPWLLLAAALAAAGWYGWQHFQQTGAADAVPVGAAAVTAAPDGGPPSP